MHLNIAMRRKFVRVRMVLAVLRAWSLLGETKEPLRKKDRKLGRGRCWARAGLSPLGAAATIPSIPSHRGLVVLPPRGTRLLPRERCRGWGTQRLGCTGVCWGALGSAGVYWGALGCTGVQDCSWHLGPGSCRMPGADALPADCAPHQSASAQRTERGV